MGARQLANTYTPLWDEVGDDARAVRRKLAPRVREILLEASNAVKRLKVLRHPGVLRFRASDEREEGDAVVFHLVTEAALPLLEFLRGADLGAQREEYLAWGVRGCSTRL